MAIVCPVKKPSATQLPLLRVMVSPPELGAKVSAGLPDKPTWLKVNPGLPVAVTLVNESGFVSVTSVDEEAWAGSLVMLTPLVVN